MNEKEIVDEAIKVLKSGGILLYPTDTIWGLTCDATNAEAVGKLAKLKGRAEHQSFIVLVNNDRLLNQCIGDIPSVAWDMIDMAASPLTLVLDKGQYVADNVINKDGSLGIRKVKSGPIEKLIYRFGKPLVSTSANFTGDVSPKNFQGIHPQLKSKVDFIYPDSSISQQTTKASKIVRIKSNGEVEILRK